MLLLVHGASFRPVAQARNRVSSLCSPPFPPPAPPSAEPIGSIFQTHVEPALLSAEPQPLCRIAALAALWSAWQPSPLTCLLRKHQTQLAKCQSGVFSPLLPHPQPGALPSSPQLSSPLAHSNTPKPLPTAHPPVGTKCEAGPVVWTSVWCCASGHSPWRPSGRRRPGGQDRLPGVGAPPCCPSNLRPLQGCLRAVQGAECTGP